MPGVWVTWGQMRSPSHTPAHSRLSTIRREPLPSTVAWCEIKGMSRRRKWESCSTNPPTLSAATTKAALDQGRAGKLRTSTLRCEKTQQESFSSKAFQWWEPQGQSSALINTFSLPYLGMWCLGAKGTSNETETFFVSHIITDKRGNFGKLI